MRAVVVDVLEKWARHRAANWADDNAAEWGSKLIVWLTVCQHPTRAKFLAAGAEKVLRSIHRDSGVLERTKSWACDALRYLGLDPGLKQEIRIPGLGSWFL